MKKLFIALLIVSSMYNIAIAEQIANEYQVLSGSSVYPPVSKSFAINRWKTSERFEISNIDGLKDTYNAGEQIVYYVKGKSERLDVVEANGFQVAATFFVLPKIKGERISVEYDTDISAWRVKFTAPKDNSKEYEIVVHLLCGRFGQDESPCSSAYGDRTQIDKFIPIQVH